MTRPHTRHNARDAAELRQYTQLLQAVKKAASAYQRRTGSRINWTYTTPEDLAADAYIIAQEATHSPNAPDPNTIHRAALEAVRRAARAQKRHAHAEIPEDAEPGAIATPDTAESAAQIADILQAVHNAGPVAVLLSQGSTVSDMARRLGVSRSTAWRLAERAREQIKAALS